MQLECFRPLRLSGRRNNLSVALSRWDILAIRMPLARWGSPHLSARKAASWRFSFRLSTLHAAWTDATLRLSPTARRPLIGQPDPDAGAGGGGLLKGKA